MRIVHSADWQIGKVFKQFGTKEESLRQARLGAIERLGAHAKSNGVHHVLVAGDVYDSEAPNSHTLRAPVERMKPFADVHWHLLPGNHDPHRPEGVWDRLAQLGLPSNVHLHLTPTPFALDDNAYLLPAPLLRKSEFDDITAWMDGAATPPGALRIGLAHGSVVNFGSEGEATNQIDRARAAKAQLDYFALGDWHRTLQVGPATWYAGTPEPDRAGGQEQGTALLVEIAGPGAAAAVSPLATGTYRWITRSERLDDESALADCDQRLRSEPDLSRLILRLRIEGSLPLAAHAAFQRHMADLEAAVFQLDLDQASLTVRPTQADLEAIDFDGVLRRSADRLKSVIDDDAAPHESRRRAEEALVELYLRVVNNAREEAGLMLITALSVEGIGRFASAARVDGFGTGVNVLAAGNEVGKSTLFKAIRTCLFCRHDSKTQEIRDLGSDDSQLPATVQLAFEHGGKRYVIKKSFLRSPSAVLTEDGREIARFAEADKAVWDILGIGPGSGRSIDDGAFGIFRVGQGSSFMAPVPGTGASSLLNAAIESEVGALIGGERARRAVDEINVELRRNLTDSERGPRSDGPLARAQDDLEHWRQAEADSFTKLSALEQQFADLTERRRRHRQITEPAAVAQMTKELTDARNSLRDAQAADQEIRRLEAETVAAKRALEGAAQRLRQYRDVASRIDANRRLETDLANNLPEHLSQEQEARAALARTAEQLVTAESEAKTLAIKEQRLERLAGALQKAQRKDDLVRRLNSLEEAAAILTEIDAQLSQVLIEPKTLERLDELDRQIAAVDAQLSAAAATLAVEVKPAGAGMVCIGSLRAKGSQAAPVLAPTKITIGDLAVITVTPAVHPRQEKRQTLEAERAVLLKSVGVTGAAEARALLACRRDLENSRRGVLAELKSLKAGDDPAAACADVKSGLAETEAAIKTALAATGRTALPNEAAIDTERLEHEQRRNALDARRASLDAARDEQQEAVETAVAQHTGAKTKLQMVRKSIAEDLALCPDADRAARDAAMVSEVAVCEMAHQTKATTLAAVRQTAPDAAEIERRELRCQRLEKALENHHGELIQLERDIGQLTGQIQAAGGDGVSEAHATAQEERILAERECARIQQRIATLQLLRDTVSGCLVDGRERYYEPVRRHLGPYINDLFPGAELELDDGFTITGMKRSRSESFKRLSGGTQEQIAVLVRLAMGTLLAERGCNVPIILDDALVYCDDDRINMMFDALSRAGKHQQIIVLTCRLRSFAPLGGHTLRVQMNGECH